MTLFLLATLLARSLAGGFALTGAAVLRAGELVTLDEDAPVLTARLQRGDGWPEGTTLLLLHGTLSHRDTEIIESLEALFFEEGISTLAVNLSLGVDARMGSFSCASRHRHREQDALEELERWMAWLDEQGVSRPVLLGHSRGANQVARFALDAGEDRLSHLVLVAPPRWSEEDAAAAYARRHARNLASDLKQAEAVLRQQGEATVLPQPVGMLYCTDALASAASFLSYYRPDPLRDTPTLLQRLSLPVLVISGSEDDVVRDLPEALDKAPRNVQTVEIDGADHFFRDLYADELVEFALDFLDP